MSQAAINSPKKSEKDLSGETFKKLVSDEAGFILLSEYLKNSTGINMPTTPKNLSLMAGRLSSLLREYNFDDYLGLYAAITGGRADIAKHFIQSLTTNTTHWFREAQHFAKLEEYITKLLNQGHRDEIKIWCAASSIGHEPYTISIVINEALAKAGKKNGYKILATDIDEDVLQKAASACYTQSELNGLSLEQSKKYLDCKTGKFNQYYRVKKEYADPVHFAKLNLLEPQFSFKNKFDIIFCRNVFIYFEKSVTHSIINKMAPFVRNGGLLFLGHAEAGAMKSDQFKSIAHAVYERL
jgi:chemotaxis protein methyltransferase CheR